MSQSDQYIEKVLERESLNLVIELFNGVIRQYEDGILSKPPMQVEEWLRDAYRAYAIARQKVFDITNGIEPEALGAAEAILAYGLRRMAMDVHGFIMEALCFDIDTDVEDDGNSGETSVTAQ